MSLEEILKAKGLSKDKIDAVTKTMEDNKIYTTSLENANKRYLKLKKQKEELEEKLKSINVYVENLKQEKSIIEELQKTIKVHENTIKNLRKEIVKVSRTCTLKDQLAKTGVLDPDYLVYKCGGIDMFDFDKDNNPIGVENIIKKFKKDKNMSYLFKTEPIEKIYTDKVQVVLIEKN